MYCAHCGTGLSHDAEFCGICGKAVLQGANSNGQFPSVEHLNSKSMEPEVTPGVPSNEKKIAVGDPIRSHRETSRNFRWPVLVPAVVALVAGLSWGGYSLYRHYQYEKYYTAGISALAAQNYSLAKSDFLTAVAIRPSNLSEAGLKQADELISSQQNFALGKEEFSKGNLNAALSALRNVIPSDRQDYQRAQALTQKIRLDLGAKGVSHVTFLGSDGSAVILPLVGIKADYGMNFNKPPSVDPTRPITPLHFTVPGSQTNHLEVYWINEGSGSGTMFIGPRGWIPTSAGIGVDGSELFSLQNPNDITQKMTVTDDGGCAGCSISDIGSYFPNLAHWAAQQGFPPSTFGTSPDFQSRQLINPSALAYQLVTLQSGYQTNGVAVMQNTGDIFFGRAEITMPTSAHELMTTMLNFYLTFH